MIKINKLFIPYIALIIVIGFGKAFIGGFIFVFLHEMAHIICARILGIKDISLKIIPMGTYIESKKIDDLKPKEDILVSLAGPFLNLIFAIIFFLMSIFIKNNTIVWCGFINLSLGLFNLVPAFPLDGARVLRALLSRKIIYKKANLITIRVSFISGFFILGLFIILVINRVFNITLLLIGLLILIISYKEKERIVYIIMGDIVKKKNRFLKDNYIENKSISVYYKRDLINLLGIVDKNKNNIFTILDENMKVLGVVYEYEVIETLKLYGNMSIEEYMIKREKKAME